MDPGKRVHVWERRPASSVIAARRRSHTGIPIENKTPFRQLL